MIGDWENLIGGKWALWIGLFSLFLAIASFLAYTWKALPPMPPAARVACGVVAGLALIGASHFFLNRAQRWFSEGLAGAGLAVLYLSIWAGAQHFHVFGFGAAFSAMSLTTVLGVYLALRFDAISLSVLATLGGFLTPLLLHGNATNQAGESLSLLVYIAVLNGGILAVSIGKRWSNLTWLSFLGTIFLVGVWMWDDYSAVHRWPTFAYFSLYFLQFAGSACFYSLARKEETAQPDLLLLFAATSIYALAGYALLDGALSALPGTFAFFLALFFALLYGATRISSPQNKTLRQSAAGLCLLFLTLTIPIQFGQKGLAIGWGVEAGVLLVLGLRLRAELLQRAGQIVWVLALIPLMQVWVEATPQPPFLFVNERALPLLLSLAATAFVVFQQWMNLRFAEQNSQTPFTDRLAGLYATYVVFGGAWILAQEIYLWFGWNHAPSASWQASALYVASSALAVFAVAAFAVGAKMRDLTIRLCALAVIAIAMSLPLWSGLSYATNEWTPFWNLRWLSYVMNALALIGCGWLLQRDAKDISADELESLALWPTIVSLFLLLGMTVEIWSGFSAKHLSGFELWRASAFFAIALLWSVYAGTLFWLAGMWQQTLLKFTACFVALCGCVLLLATAVGYSELGWAPYWNLRAVAFGVTAIVLIAIASSDFRRGEKANVELISIGAALLATLVLLWGFSLESYELGRHFKTVLGRDWSAISLFGITCLWNVGALILLRLGLKFRLPAFRMASYNAMIVTISVLLYFALDATRMGWTPLFNARFGAFVFAACTLGAGSIWNRKNQLSDWEQWSGVVLGWAAAALLLWGITQEAHETCFYFRALLGGHWGRWAQMTISLAWSVYGASLLIGGINRNYQPLRLVALGVLTATILKVFLFDLGFLDGFLRMLSLAGLGVALIFISWLYGRYARASADANAP
jgi:uncharacterized membrane protein